jgi:uncharacterized protein
MPRERTGSLRRSITVTTVGLISGALSGLLGIGGGLVMVPALLLLRVPPKEASATSLAAIVPIALAGAVVFQRGASLDFGAGAWLAVGSVAGVTVGAALLRRLNDLWLQRAFGAFLLCVALLLLVR